MKKLKKITGWFLMISGVIFILIIILAMTTAPFWMWYRLGTKKAGISCPPDYIVLLGGGGMPSESALMRSWYTARAAKYFTRATVIIAQPGNAGDSLSTLFEIRNELVLRGVAPERILMEDSGTNTRAQAINIFQELSALIQNQKSKIKDQNHGLKVIPSKNDLQGNSSPMTGESNNKLPVMHHGSHGTTGFPPSILIVTSPEHLCRAVLAFQKAGFKKVGGLPAFEKDVESDLSFVARKLGGRRFIPDVGENIVLRYKFWTHLQLESMVLREYMALAYYWMMGWI